MHLKTNETQHYIFRTLYHQNGDWQTWKCTGHVTLQQSSPVVWAVPGESDRAGRDLAHPDGGGHGGLDHPDGVADAVLAVHVLHGADHARQVLLD